MRGKIEVRKALSQSIFQGAFLITLTNLITQILPCQDDFFCRPQTLALRNEFHTDGLLVYYALVALILALGYCLPVNDPTALYQTLCATTTLTTERIKEVYLHLIENGFFTQVDGVLTNARTQLLYALTHGQEGELVTDLIPSERLLLNPEQLAIFDGIFNASSLKKESDSKEKNSSSSSSSSSIVSKKKNIKRKELTPSAPRLLTKEEKAKMRKLKKALPSLDGKLYNATMPDEQTLETLILVIKDNPFYRSTYSADWLIRNCENIIEQETSLGVKTKLPTVSREQFYEQNRSAAEAKADKALAKARGNADFLQNEKEMAQNNRDLGIAQAFGYDSVKDLTRLRTELLAKRKAILTSLRLTEDDLNPRYHCALCSDTGFKENGRLCSCYDEA